MCPDKTLRSNDWGGGVWGEEDSSLLSHAKPCMRLSILITFLECRSNPFFFEMDFEKELLILNYRTTQGLLVSND
jgi:hypothetical protein